MRTHGATVLAFLLGACGGSGSDTETPDAGGDTGRVLCASDADCDDSLFCNGTERCDPSSASAMEDGCVAGTPPCATSDTCNEINGSCDTACPDADGDGHADDACGGDDCDDSDANRFPGNTETCDPESHDEDCDPRSFGFRDSDGDAHPDALCCNTDESGTFTCGDDCNDSRPDVYMGQVETCDGSDNDCDGATDEGALGTYTIDADGDGHGAIGGATMEACFRPQGYADSADDCDDTKSFIHPGAVEQCDEPTDDNCDGTVDEMCDCTPPDTRPCAEPGECAAGTETCIVDRWSMCSHIPVDEVCNGLDDDCDGVEDEMLLVDCYPDPDDDGYAAATVLLTAICPDVSGQRSHVAGCPFRYTNRPPLGADVDCMENDPAVNPGEDEACNMADEDCDGRIDEELIEVTRYVDSDGDGRSGTPVLRCIGDPASSEFETDCNEMDDTVYEGAPELCDRIDNDCSQNGADEGQVDPSEDMDDDGFAPEGITACSGGFPATDCNDNDPLSYPGASEYCGGGDNDCDATVDEDPDASDSCVGADGTARCLANACHVIACDAGFGDCDHDGSNGCETDVSANAAHCGGCDDACGTGGACVDGRCDPIIDLSSGENHTCAVREGGRILCWGNNGFGKLGDGTIADAARPTLVVTAVSDAVQVAAGTSHTCALRTGGTVVCWGRGTDGQIGDGTTPSQRVRPMSPDVALTDVVEVSAGGAHTCARTGAGQVYCWGDNARGQLGSDPAGLTTSSTPVLVAGVSNAVEIDLGLQHSCARIMGGDVMCWGDNGRGQVGDGTTTGLVHTPTLVTGLANIESRNMSAGRNHTCVRRANQRVACWGANTYGQLGVDPASVSERGSAAVVPGLFATTHVQLGHYHSCARDDNRELWCWGRDNQGQLGDGTVGTDVYTPQRMSIDSGILVSDVRPGVGDGGEQMHCFARATGQVACVGLRGTAGILGDGITGGSSALPVTVLDVTKPTNVSGGFEHTCVRFDVGRMACWGDNSTSQLGEGSDPLVVTSRPVATGVFSTSDARFVRAGEAFSCALRATGRPVCWGDNTVGQLGNDNAPTGSATPVGVNGITDAIDVQVGAEFACALRQGGVVSCWGRDHVGQLGDGSPPDPPGTGTEYSAVPVNVVGLSSPVALFTGNAHACVLNADGTIQCWGSDDRRELGDANAGGFDNAPTMSTIAGMVALSAGGNHTCGLGGDGVMSCWGGNSQGQLGHAPYGLAAGSAPVDTPFMDWVAVAAGGSHTCGVRMNGEVHCWGRGDEGQIGNSMSIQQDTPQLTNLSDTDVRSIEMGRDHGCALRATGEVECWGRNDFGQLGDNGGPTDQDTPVPVLLMP